MSTADTALAGRPKVTVARAAKRHPRAEAEYRRGLDLAKRQRWQDAARAYRRATQLNPDDAVFWLNLAHAFVKLGELERAVDAARRAVAIDPDSELAISIATQCLTAANRHAETIDLLERLDLSKSVDPNPHFALADAYFAVFRYEDAIREYLAALRHKPDLIAGHVNLGNVFERMKMHVEARECFKTALALGGNRGELISAMAYQSQHACRWDLFAEDRAELADAFAQGLTQAAPFQLLAMQSTRAQQLAAAQARWKDTCAAVAPMSRPEPRKGGERIRLGYMTNDIYRHATAYLIAEILEHHDRERFELFVYSYGQDDGSEIRQRICAAAGAGFVDVREISDRALAERIRADDIDILLDLKGYTLGSRFRVMAFHPARVQVNYLGYPGTFGSRCHEYIVGDAVVSPLEHADGYSEKIAQMPHCYQPNDRRRPIGTRPERVACGLPPQGFVFCSFNNCYKITAPVFERWCRLLRRVVGSVLWLYEANPQGRQNLLEEARRRGVDPARIVWAQHVDLSEHLGRLQLADLALDTLPVNAHTTASDALWAGVPMITTPGDTFVSRVAASVLRAAGLEELVAGDGDAYEALALELALDPARLGRLRARMAAGRDNCALFDSARYTHDLEDLYERMAARWERGEPPAHLPARS